MTSAAANDRPFHLLVVADLGGGPGTRPRGSLEVDRDRLEAVLARVGATIDVPDGAAGNPSLPLAVRSLADLHPDALVRAVPGLAELMRARATAPAAPAPQPISPVPVAARPAAHGGGLLDAILDDQPADSEMADAVSQLAREAVRGSRVQGDASSLARWQAEVDETIGTALRLVLRTPAFRRLEATWRGVHALVRDAETGPELVVRLLEARRADAAAALEEELGTPGAPAPAAVVAAHTYGAGDVAMLAELASVGRRFGCAVVADADVSLLGLTDVVELADPGVRERIGQGEALEPWRRLCATAGARHLALCLPRILLRAPYGAAAERVESFAFEELADGGGRADLCWGSPALAFGRVFVRAFAADGWAMDLDSHGTLDGLPLVVLQENGESTSVPCAEVVMSERTLARVAEENLVPLGSFRDQDVVRFYGIGTIAGSALELG